MKPTMVDAKTKQAAPQPLERFHVLKTTTAGSITKQEIARFWMQKRIDEEEHLLAALKAAARIRARNLSEEDYKQFEDSLTSEGFYNAPGRNVDATINSKQEKNNNEVRISIKDWWTKTNSAYLNQPDIESMDTPMERASPNALNCFRYKPISAVSSMYWTRYFD